MIADTREPMPPAIWGVPNPSPQSGGLSGLREGAQRQLEGVIVGYDEPIELAMIAALAGGHVLLQGPPGVAKTLMAEAVARMLGVDFDRHQFTAETTTLEILGKNGVRTGDPAFLPGPIFTNVFLAEDFDRSSSPTQLAVLDAMQGRAVTFAGRTYWLPAPFMVIATVGSHSYTGGAPLSITGLDRFLFRVALDYPSGESECAIVRLPHRALAPDVLTDIQPLLDSTEILAAYEQVEATSVAEAEVSFAVEIVRRTRVAAGVVLGASPRAAVHLVGAAKARARLDARTAVSPDDICAMAPHVLAHRLVVSGVDPLDVVAAAVHGASG